MTLSNNPVFAQAPKTVGISFAGSSETAEMDPATVAPTTLLTAGADGAVVTSVKVFSETTTTAEKVVLWVQPAGAGNWYPVKQVVNPAHTMAATTAQTDVNLVNKNTTTEAVRLGAGDVLGVTHHVDQQSMVMAEYTDF